MAMISLGRAFSDVAAADPDAPAVTCDGLTTTRGQLEVMSNRMARHFADLGVGEGDMVTIGLPNSAEFFAATIATWKLGAVPQPVSSRLPDIERQAIVELADARVVLGADPSAHPGRACLPLGWLPDETLSAEPLDDDHVPPVWKAPTSGGSTGRPKLILSGEAGLIDPTVPQGIGAEAGSTMLIPGPMYHNGPFSYGTKAVVIGNHVVTMARFDALATLEMIQAMRPTWALVVPTMMLRMTRLPNRMDFDVSSLRVVWHLGAPCPPWLKQDWIEWFGAETIMELYAGTEAQMVTVIRGDEWLAHRGSVGKPMIGEMRILDAERNDLPVGEVGEVFMRPPAGRVTYRYVGAESKPLDGGWESLGDMGYVDDDGYLYLTDRLGDMIMSGGANIYPAEVEHAIDEHPAVQSSAVIGLPDEDLGNRVHGIVQLRPGAQATVEELLAHLGQRLVRYKVPRTIEFTDDALRDDAGKVRRSALRAERLDPR